jgi:hypothetical protein
VPSARSNRSRFGQSGSSSTGRDGRATKLSSTSPSTASCGVVTWLRSGPAISSAAAGCEPGRQQYNKRPDGPSSLNYLKRHAPVSWRGWSAAAVRSTTTPSPLATAPTITRAGDNMRGWSTSGSLGSGYGEKTMARIRCGARRLRSSRGHCTICSKLHAKASNPDMPARGCGLSGPRG